jgi:hypothetical protein
MNKGFSLIEIVVAAIAGAATLAAVGVGIFFLRGETVYREPVDLSAGRAEVVLSLPEGPRHRVFLVMKARYTGNYSYRMRTWVVCPDESVYEEQVWDSDVASNANTTTTSRHFLFELPPGGGRYALTLAVEKLSGGIAIQDVQVLVKEVP